MSYKETYSRMNQAIMEQATDYMRQEHPELGKYDHRTVKKKLKEDVLRLLSGLERKKGVGMTEEEIGIRLHFPTFRIKDRTYLEENELQTMLLEILGDLNGTEQHTRPPVLISEPGPFEDAQRNREPIYRMRLPEEIRPKSIL